VIFLIEARHDESSRDGGDVIRLTSSDVFETGVQRPRNANLDLLGKFVDHDSRLPSLQKHRSQ